MRTNPVKMDLEKLPSSELHKLFLIESGEFISKLTQPENTNELERIKQRVKFIMEILEKKKQAEA